MPAATFQQNNKLFLLLNFSCFAFKMKCPMSGTKFTVASGAGPRAWERTEAGGVNGNERHLRHSPVSSPTEELRKG